MRIRSVAISAALAVLAAAPATTTAGVAFSIQDLGEAGGVRSLEVLATNTGADDVWINAFSFALRGDDVNFLLATVETTTSPYIFAGHSFIEDLLGPDALGFPDFQDPAIYRGADFYLEPDGHAVLAAGATASLGRVVYEATSASFRVSLLGPPDTEVVYVAPPAVPEPSALASGLAAAAAAAMLRRRAA